MKSPRLRGRPRSAEAHQAILEAALAVVLEVGFRTLTIDAVAAEAEVGKMTIYRRWPNKAALVMDAFLTLVSPSAVYPPAPSATERLRRQMHLQIKLFRSKYGRTIKALVGEAQFDPELAVAFRERWIVPRRQMAVEVLREGIAQGEFRADIDPDGAVELLYAPLYYRLQLQTGPLTTDYADFVLDEVTSGLKPRK